MKTKNILALGIIAGTEEGINHWKVFFDIKRPTVNRENESLQDYRHRINRIVKEESIKYLGELLNNIMVPAQF